MVHSRLTLLSLANYSQLLFDQNLSIRGSSEYLCCEDGIFWSHLIGELMLFENTVFRVDVRDILSQIIKIRIMILDDDIILPSEKILFQKISVWPGYCSIS